MSRTEIAYRVLGQCEESRQRRLSELVTELGLPNHNPKYTAYLVAELAWLDVRSLRAQHILDRCAA